MSKEYEEEAAMINPKEGYCGILKVKLDHARKKIQEQGRKIQLLEHEIRRLKLELKKK